MKNNNNNNGKKVFHIWVGYGKNEKYVDARNVVEDAVEGYKKEMEEEIRGRGWKKEIVFRVWDTGSVINENGSVKMGAITVDGWKIVNVD